MKKRASRPANLKAKIPTNKELVALTVKIDSETYIRLSTLRAKDRKTAQEILTDALNAYLERAGA